jgi:hypothetical protein
MEMNADHWFWGNQVVACIDDLRYELEEHQPRIVDREIIPSFTGSPDGISVWLIGEKAADLEKLKIAQGTLKARIKECMKARGFQRRQYPASE